jgi:hypothetical protein
MSRRLAKRPEDPVTWEEVYKDWQLHWLFEGEAAPGAEILDLPFVSPKHGGRIHAPVIDWWPTAAIPERKGILEKWGVAAFVMSPPWTTNKGTLHTADSLAAAENSEEAAAVWLGAALRDFLEPLPEAWSGDTFRLLDSVNRAVRTFLAARNFGRWHHAMRRALPENILIRDLAEFTLPRERRHVITLACLSVTLVRARWTVVRVIPSESPLRSVE